MPQPRFSYPDPRPRKGPDQMLFDECARVARQGRSNRYRLGVSDRIDIPYTPGGLGRPGLLSFHLDFVVDLPVVAEGTGGVAVLTEYRYEGGDAAREQHLRTPVWFGREMRAGISAPQDGNIPAYLKALAVELAVSEAERRLDDGRTPENLFKGITDVVMDELGKVAIHVDSSGTVMLSRRIEPPKLTIVPNPVLGGKAYLNVVTSEADVDGGWKESLLSFPIGDCGTAYAIRDRLVEEHCPALDRDYGADWADTRITGPDYARIERVEGFGEGEVSENTVSKPLRDFALALMEAKAVDLDARAELEAIVYDGGDDGELIPILNAAVDRAGEDYARFVRASGWDLPFDPMDFVRLRFGRSPGLDADPMPIAPHFGAKG